MGKELWSNRGSRVLSGSDALKWLRNLRNNKEEPAQGSQQTLPGGQIFRGRVDMDHLTQTADRVSRGQARPESDTWTCETSEVTGRCPLLKEEKTTVRIPYPMYYTWMLLAKKNKDEWFAYVTGDYDEATGNATVDGYYFPPQKASLAHCEPIQGSFEFRPRTIGSVHSHNTMGAFFSGTDLAHMNWQVEMVINAKGDMVGKTRVKFECGKFGRYDANMVLAQPEGLENEAAEALAAALAAGKSSSREPEKEEQSSSVERYGFGYGGFIDVE